jgi:hypothetical protein
MSLKSGKGLDVPWMQQTAAAPASAQGAPEEEEAKIAEEWTDLPSEPLPLPGETKGQDLLQRMRERRASANLQPPDSTEETEEGWTNSLKSGFYYAVNAVASGMNLSSQPEEDKFTQLQPSTSRSSLSVSTSRQSLKDRSEAEGIPT